MEQYEEGEDTLADDRSGLYVLMETVKPQLLCIHIAPIFSLSPFALNFNWNS